MKKRLPKKVWYILIVLVIVLVNFVSSRIRTRFDLTDDKRFTLLPASKKILSSLDAPVEIRVVLAGELPAEFKKLSLAVEDLLYTFNYYAHGNIHFTFRAPFTRNTHRADSSDKRIFDSLYRLGLRPTNVEKNMQDAQGSKRQVVFPGAVLRYKNREIGINFLAENLINSVQSLAKAEALLEYKFLYAIDKLIRPEPIFIAYATGHGEPMDMSAYDMFRTLARSYRVDTLNLRRAPFIPAHIRTLLIVRPTQTFNDLEKIKIDQFIMRGGRVFFALNMVRADMAQLLEKGQLVAMTENLNLDDLLFQYGVRLNYNLILDRRADRLPFQVGWNGDKPQFEFLPWIYNPLLQGSATHPITKNTDYILSRFASSIDTTSGDSIQKTPLLFTSNLAKKTGVPQLISWKTISEIPQTNTFFSNPFLMVGVLSQARFTAYSQALTTGVNNLLHKNFPDTFALLDHARAPSKIIVLGDADILLNEVSPTRGALEMGMNAYTNYEFANKTFFENAVEYLSSDNGLISARTRDVTLRLLDKKRVAKEKSFWRTLNLILPVGLVALFFAIYNIVRYRRYKHAS